MDREERRRRRDIMAERRHVKPVRTQRPRVGPCPCECNSGGFCGGCGHVGCGGR